MLFCMGLTRSLRAQEVPLPAGERVTWGQEPTEASSATRGAIVLNGLWRFQPGTVGAKEPTATGWGYIRVPGSWRTGYTEVGIPGVIAPGNGPGWDAWKADTLAQGWYERPLAVPADWAGRAVVLNLTRVSTDAFVYVDGHEAGRVGWPSGEVDLTPWVTPGRPQTLRVFVAAIPSQEQVGTFMGPGAGQLTFGEAKLASKGLIDDVLLEARPKGAHVSDVFVQPSTRRKQVALNIELTGVRQSGPVRLTARMVRNGRVEKTFTGTMSVKGATVQTVRIAWPWADPALWDLNRPNVYTLKLRVEGTGIRDEYAQPFGFREFWIQGRQIFLNGVPFRMRPTVMPQEYSSVQGNPALVEGAIQGIRGTGYNIGEMWPGTSERRGQNHFHHVYYDVADRLGFPLMGSCGNVGDFSDWGGGWKSAAARREWERLTTLELRQGRNHPSVLLWSSSGNSFGHGHDQHPLAVGRKLEQTGLPFDKSALGRAEFLRGALGFLRQQDLTRPSFLHQGILGDLYAVNSYLDWMPLQEDEEWLSDWTVHGTEPYFPCEFGAPLAVSYQRGRQDYGQAEGTEPFLTEFAAIYLGARAYRLETPDYRRAMREHFVGGASGQEYRNWQNEPARDHSPTHMTLQPKFTQRIWRSWRALGTTAGMVPWDDGYAWSHPGPPEEINAPPFRPGQRGTYSSHVRRADLLRWQPAGGWTLTPAGQALVENDGPTLAFLGGKAVPGDVASITDKQHAFWVGGRIEKQAVLLNDTRTAQPFTLTWRARLGGRVIASGARRGTLAPAQNLFLPVAFTAPPVRAKSDGVLEMTARIGGTTHADTFPFRVWPRPAPSAGKLMVWDPAGRTLRMLRALGYQATPWDGQEAGGLLVVGRGALSGGAKAPGDLDAFARGGGRVLLMTQDPEWMRRVWGFRIAPQVGRQVFRLDTHHAVVAGLDADDLHDWAGTSDLLPAHSPLPARNEEPPYGWHWGNRGGVCSAMVEKPHLAGWRPILECGFDLAYTSLMELDYGRGRVTLCTLDLEERFAGAHEASEPAADRLARQLVRYARTAPLSPRAGHVALLGTPPAWFQMLGVVCDRVAMPPADAALVIVAPDALPDEAALTASLQAGGRVVFLPRTGATAPLGATLAQRTVAGSLDVPAWSMCAGLSPSDLRWRNEASAWLVSGGAGVQVGAGGQIATKSIGNGLAVWLQTDPERFDADRTTYFRFTRWRQTRAVAQVLANLGATFRDDVGALRTVPADPQTVGLAGTWRLAITAPRPSAAKAGDLPDPGISDAAKRLVDGSAPMAQTVALPGGIPALESQDGEAVVRREVNIPAAWAGKDLILEPGKIDDFDITFWNGGRVGGLGAETSDAWNTPRRYTLPGRLVRAGRNVLAVRLWDWYGGGGFNSLAADMTLHPAEAAPPRLYHPDYRTDFILGDDPYRYKRW